MMLSISLGMFVMSIVLAVFVGTVVGFFGFKWFFIWGIVSNPHGLEHFLAGVARRKAKYNIPSVRIKCPCEGKGYL